MQMKRIPFDQKTAARLELRHQQFMAIVNWEIEGVVGDLGLPANTSVSFDFGDRGGFRAMLPDTPPPPPVPSAEEMAKVVDKALPTVPDAPKETPAGRLRGAGKKHVDPPAPSIDNPNPKA